MEQEFNELIRETLLSFAQSTPTSEKRLEKQQSTMTATSELSQQYQSKKQFQNFAEYRYRPKNAIEPTILPKNVGRAKKTSEKRSLEDLDDVLQSQRKFFKTNGYTIEPNYSPIVDDRDQLYIPNDSQKWLKTITICNKLYGHVGQLFHTYATRKDVANDKIHAQVQTAIDGFDITPACAIVAANQAGYHEDDYGEVLIYSGQGGGLNEDQVLTRYNLSLATNYKEKFPVRVIRGSKLGSAYAPNSGYRYDGVYFVTAYWSERIGTNGPLVYKFRLVRCPGQVPIPKRQVLEISNVTDVQHVSSYAEMLKKRERYKNIVRKRKKKEEPSSVPVQTTIQTDRGSVIVPTWFL